MPTHSFDRFWRTIRSAPRYKKPWRVQQAGQPDRLVYLDEWLTTSIVSDYDRRDFGFLPREERDELDNAVREFEQIAGEVDPTGPTTKEQRERAWACLERIMRILHVDQYADPLAFRVDRVLETYKAKLCDLLPGIKELRGEIGTDHEDRTLIQVYVIVEDEAARAPNLFEAFQRLENAIQQILAAHQVEEWVMVHLRTVSENEKLRTP